eukprot:CAMPEP_0117426024 /NCGR_PEP_ID=MMETSP0758-20121206/6208_1 /TAXON_ID=63605 /ORGANISM="Percolomonas cosmopolitus, Strain AE-1 (ATCC 50343)" /LENGTH=330 /DNA_ID=CAMNT_0005210919 /DNA_START=32 /DNA_END=1024 /DNA_ORIENTATION=+
MRRFYKQLIQPQLRNVQLYSYSKKIVEPATFFKDLKDKKPLKGKVAIITGSTRGIGKQIARDLAAAGANIVITGKSKEENPKLPGTIYSVAEEIANEFGVETLPVKVNVREDEDIENMVKETVQKWNRVDILVNNAGALWWKPMEDTPMNRYDLVHEVNARATFAACHAVLPHLKEGGSIVNMSPPVDTTWASNKIAYSISKLGMTIIAHGLADELKDRKIAVNALWPLTAIESYATRNHKIGEASSWRKPTILSDCILALSCQSSVFSKKKKLITGKALLDEELLRDHLNVNDFTSYRMDPDVEPPILTLSSESLVGMGLVKDNKKETL